MESRLLPIQVSWTWSVGVSIAGGLWLFWRFWRFSLGLGSTPGEPEQLPYWIPFLGHALKFGKDPQSVFRHGQEHFAQNGRPYAVTIAGQIFYVLTDPQDFSCIYRNAATFVFEPLVEQVYRSFLVSKTAIESLHHQEPSSGKNSAAAKPTEQVSRNISHDMIVVDMRGKQTHNHPRKALSQMEQMMSLESICSRFSTVQDGASTTVSLFNFCFIIVAAAGQAPYFGDCLSHIDPHIPETYIEFDKLCSQIFFRPPFLWSKQFKQCRAKILKALETYADTPLESRPDTPQFLQTWETECRKAGVQTPDIAILMSIQYFGLNTNTPKVCFWLLCHILFNPKLIHDIRTETSAAFTSGAYDHEIVDKSKTLNAVWFETLRLSASSLSVRYITEDFELKGLKLRKGRQVLLNARLLHIEPEHFGADPLTFDATRFVKHPSYARHVAFRPFGGGQSQCPGRQMAKQTALTFVAYLLHTYDVELAQPQEFPKPNFDNHPGVAVMAPAKGQDLSVRLTQRRKGNEA